MSETRPPGEANLASDVSVASGTRVHLDHNATTPLGPEARQALFEAYDRLGGNPSSVHTSGRAARAMLDEARESIAASLGVFEDDIVFTAGGTEANNLALMGALAAAGPGSALVTTTIEHSAVLEPARRLAERGHTVKWISVDQRGRADLAEIIEAAAGSHLVSVMCANNEVGSTTDIGALVEGLAARYGAGERPRVHTDAVQALGKLPVDLARWDVDLASFSGHKVGGPVGVGILIRRRGVALEPQTLGGGQEGGLRPGTENVAAIHSMAVAVQLAVKQQPAFALRSRQHVEKLWRGLCAAAPGVRLLGPDLDDTTRLPNTLNVHVPGTDGRTWVARLDLEGLEASSGSACASGSLEPSHVVGALGYDRQTARASLRLSCGPDTSDADIAHAVETLSRTLGKAL